MIFPSFSNLSPWTYVVIALVLTHVTVASVTIFLHRHQAHRAIELHPAVSHFFRFWLWLTTGTVTREWVAVHRKHHAYVESADDPHSPQVKGISTVVFQGARLYVKEARKAETQEEFGKGTPCDWIENNLYTRFRNVGLILMALIDVLLFGWVGLIIYAVQIVWIPFWAAGVINGVGHYWGYRSFETADASRNILPIGVIMGGEELHNNHHAYRQSARFSSKWWELDIGWLYISLLERLCLATVMRTAPRTCFVAKDIVDVATVKAVLRNRYHVLKLYGANVIGPVLRKELRDTQPRKHLRRLRNWLVREDLDLDVAEREAVDEVLSANQVLRAVVDFKEQLKALMQPTIGKNARVARLQEWCANAEATGIGALREFAMQLRGYSMRQA
ncbi:MAG TPA: fatty acid desaturase [Woeseiaceae bacterium]|nr:fatty acid desaturase [Woeseiaceae bacterium]